VPHTGTRDASDAERTARPRLVSGHARAAIQREGDILHQGLATHMKTLGTIIDDSGYSFATKSTLP